MCHLNNECPEEKIRNLAAVIRLAGADVVVLQEVHTGAHGAVQRLVEQAGQAGGSSWNCCLSGPTGTEGHAKGECYALLFNEAEHGVDHLSGWLDR